MKPIISMTLGNMRANGVRTLAAWCLGRGTFSWNKVPTVRLYYEHDPLKA
jgi:hypothetical protein